MTVEDLKIISEQDVPAKQLQHKWQRIFESIPEGKAAVFSAEDVPNLYAIFRFHHQKGRFPNYYVVQRNKKYYVVNSKKQREAST